MKYPLDYADFDSRFSIADELNEAVVRKWGSFEPGRCHSKRRNLCNLRNLRMNWIWFFSHQCIRQDLGGVQRNATGSVFDLVAATGARRGNDGIARR